MTLNPNTEAKLARAIGDLDAAQDLISQVNQAIIDSTNAAAMLLRSTPGTVGASLPLVADANSDISGLRTINLTAGGTDPVAVSRIGASSDEGLETRVIDEIVTLTNAVTCNLTHVVPSGATILAVQANLETAITGDGSGDAALAKVGIGTVASPAKYGMTTGLSANLKVDTIPSATVLGSDEQIAVRAVKTDGTACTEKFTAAGQVRVRVVFSALASLTAAQTAGNLAQSPIYFRGPTTGGIWLGNNTVSMTSYTTIWTVPDGVTTIRVECWGAGGGAWVGRPLAGDGNQNNWLPGGGGGGAFASQNFLSVTPGDQYRIRVGFASRTFNPATLLPYDGGDSSFARLDGTVIVLAKGGRAARASQGSGELGGLGGQASGCIGSTTRRSGGNGADGYVFRNSDPNTPQNIFIRNGGGGGSSATYDSAGVDGVTGGIAIISDGGTAGFDGGNGGRGATGWNDGWWTTSLFGFQGSINYVNRPRKDPPGLSTATSGKQPGGGGGGTGGGLICVIAGGGDGQVKIRWGDI